MITENATNLSVPSTMNLSSVSRPGSDSQIEALSVLKIFQVFAYYFAIFLSLVGNAVVIKAIKRIGRTSRRKVHYLFIMNLSAADLLFAIENIPIICTHLLLEGAWQIQGRFGKFLCQFDVFFSALLILTSNLTILAIAVEKFLAIFFPLKTFVSKKRAYLTIASTWLASGLYCAPLFFFAYLEKDVEDPNGKVICSVCLNCEKVVRWFIFQTILLAAGFIITLALYSAIGIKIWLRKAPGIQLYEVQRRGQAKKHKALKMLATLVFVFYISFIPFWLYQLSLHFGFYTKLGSYYSIISASLMLCNGAINPVIYSIYNADIRREFKSLFTCKSPCSAITFQSSPKKKGNGRKKEYRNVGNSPFIYNYNLYEDSRL